jgi:signal transduction histidine kinase
VLARPEPADDAQITYSGICRELHHTTLALRHAVDMARTQCQALEARNAALGVQLQTRKEQLQTLQDLSIGLARHDDMASLVNEALGALEQTMRYSSASVWARSGLDPQHPVVLLGYRSEDDELAGIGLSDLTGLRLSRANLQRYEQIERDGQMLVENRQRQSLLSWLWAMVTDDARTSALYRRTRAWIAVPLKVRDRVLGVLRVDHAEQDFFDVERSRLLAAVGGQTAMALRHVHLLAERRELAVVAERNRIARELHDAVSQTLFASHLLAGTLARSAGAHDPMRQQAQVLERLNRSAQAELRMMLFELRPDALESVRLPELLQQAVEAVGGRGEIEVLLECEPDAGLPTALRIEIYRIAQEALSNIARHSGARHARVGWSSHAPGKATLRISDDGCGFDPAVEKPGHFGLGHMRDRARLTSSTLQIKSAPGEGTEIVLDVNWS